MKRSIVSILVAILFMASVSTGQTNEFTYQGRLNDGANPANGTYDFQIALYASSPGGLPVGTRDRLGVVVANGIFTVSLDFPSSDFNGNNRWLEIRVKPAGGGSYTTLTPRQRITSSPYGIRSASAASADTAVNATQLGGVPAASFVQTTDPRLSDARNPLPGSSNYIQNNSGLGQTANLSITGFALIGGNTLVGGDLTVNGNRINLGGSSRFLGNTGTGNTFAGINTGPVNTGTNNSFFGFNAGNDNNTGVDNVFLGSDAGGVNTNGDENTFVGSDTGDSNMTGDNNTFVGRSAGTTNTEGNNNTYIGWNAGGFITTGDNNTFIGALAGSGPGVNRSFSTSIGAGAINEFSNSIILGRPGGEDDVRTWGSVSVGRLPAGGSTSACLTGGPLIGMFSFTQCSSSLRYKTNISQFTPGLNLVNRLKPITFNWKKDGMADLGLGAEDVAAIEPLLVTYNDKGQIEGVKYDRIGVVLLNAVKEQQAQIERQQKQLDEQRLLIEGLRKLVCTQTPAAAVCVEVK